MLSTVGRRIFLATEPMDMRRGIDRLAGWVEGELRADPFAGDLFVFLSRDARRVKVLAWESSGYWLCMKRLESGRFSRPRTRVLQTGEVVVTLSPAELGMLLEGIEAHRVTYREHHHRPPGTNTGIP
jgi:transposase